MKNMKQDQKTKKEMVTEINHMIRCMDLLSFQHYLKWRIYITNQFLFTIDALFFNKYKALEALNNIGLSLFNPSSIKKILVQQKLYNMDYEAIINTYFAKRYDKEELEDVEVLKIFSTDLSEDEQILKREYLLDLKLSYRKKLNLLNGIYAFTEELAKDFQIPFPENMDM